MRIKTTIAVLALLGGLAAPALVASAPVWAAFTLPDGFRLVDYPTGQGEFNLTNFEFTEDGGLLTVGKNGRVGFTPPGGSPYELAQVPGVRSVGDYGLLGLSLGKDYSATGRVFLLYPRLDDDGSGHGHAVLSEWKASPPLRPTSFTQERTIIDGSGTSPAWTQSSASHAIGTVLQAEDGSLFVGNGDEASASAVDPDALRAQDVDDPHGKILHILPDGRGHPSNPFYDPAAPSSWRSRLYAYGFRNPFRFTIDPRTGALVVGDVGWRTDEELNLVTAGKNYGWPCYEGSDRQPGYAALDQCKQLYAQPAQPVTPLWTYSHAAGNASVVGGAFYQGSVYPASFRGAYFFGDYSRQRIWTVQTDPAGQVLRAPEANGFGVDIGGPVALHNGPNGDIAFANILDGTVRRLVYAPGNRPPNAVMSASVDASSMTVGFSGDQSFDLDGDALTYSWNFGDGSTSSGVSPTHTYGAAGTYQVTLTVTDRLGASGSAIASVTPDNYSPTLALDTPDKPYAVGEQVRITATASDREDGNLSGQVRWQLALVHCPSAGSCHTHPEGETTGATFTAPFTDHGSDTAMVITASVADTKGTTTKTVHEVKPDLHTLAVEAPVAVRINGIEQASAQAVTGSTNSVEAPATQSYWQFVGWDGGVGARQVTMPDHDLTLVAKYRTAIDARYEALGGASSGLREPTAAEYDVPGGRARDYQGGRMYWSAATGARYVVGSILTKYRTIGAHTLWGFPTTDEIAVAGGRASYFQKARIYWTAATGAHEVHGALLTRYLAMGGPAGYGFPITDEVSTADRVGRYNHFTSGRSIYWTRATGAHTVKGRIRATWMRLGAERGRLRYPITDELPTSYGAVSRFQGGRIEWHRSVKQTKVIYSK